MLLAHTANGPVYVFDRPTRILAVDDDPIMREFAAVQLAQPGVTIVTAADGEEAWARLEGDARRFDLVLCDLEMPRLNGFGLLDRMRGDPRFRDLPVVVITSRDDLFAIDRAYEVGATSFVTKPVNWRLLGYQLRYVLRAAGMEAEVRQARDAAERASRLKANLLALLQHETRTPLHLILGYADLLHTLPTGREPVERIIEAARGLAGTLNRIFLFAQLHAGTLTLQPEPVDVGEAVGAAIEEAKSQLMGGVPLALERAGAAAVEADPRYIVLALTELLIAAGQAGPVRITCGRNGAEVALSIEGCGGLAGLDGAGDPFLDDGDPLSREKQRLELGPALARLLIGLHGGRLERPRPGLLTLTFPAADSAALRLHAPAA
jgi:two-component system, sensor histidine kinase and response regulator